MHIAITITITIKVNTNQGLATLTIYGYMTIKFLEYFVSKMVFGFPLDFRILLQNIDVLPD